MNRRTSIMTGLAGVTAVAALSSTANAADAKADNPELKNVRALLKAHDKAMTNHDLDGVLATYAADAVIMGTGPGEWYAGTAAIKEAYGHFFEGFDKGAQEFDYTSRAGGLSTDMGWMVTAGNVKGKLKGKKIAFPVNISLTVTKADGKWKFASMHFSSLTGEDKAAPAK
jgi:uncharacterized protein (TIGR02246 family)